MTLGIHPKSRSKSISLFEMLATVCRCGKFIVPMMRVFRRQSCVIQCILIAIKLSAVGLIQKLVMKAMSISATTPSISILMSFLNCSLSPSTDLVTLCFDMFGHQSSHFLMNLKKPGWVPICKGRFFTAHNRVRFTTQRFLSALPRPYSCTHSSNVLCP